MNTENLKAVQKLYIGRHEKTAALLLNASRALPLICGVCLLILGFIVPEVLLYAIFMAVLCFLPFFVSIMVTNKCQQKIWKRFSEEEIERINQQCLTTKHVGPLLITQDAVVYLLPGYIMALPIRDIVWVYKQEKTWVKGTLSNGVSSLYIVLRDKTIYTTLNNHSFGHQIIDDAITMIKENLQGQRPNLLYGYSNERKELYANRFDNMVKTADGKSSTI